MSKTHNKHKNTYNYGKKNHMGVDEQLYNAILEVLKRNYSSSLTAAKVEKACGEALTAGLRVAASMAEAIGIPNVEMLCQARNQIEANIESLKEEISKENDYCKQFSPPLRSVDYYSSALCYVPLPLVAPMGSIYASFVIFESLTRM